MFPTEISECTVIMMTSEFGLFDCEGIKI